MELPQPRPYGAQGRKPTHDFLSLYSPAQQDPSPTTPGSCYLETHDFLQPLERVVSKEENKVEPSTARSLPLSAPTAVEHILPGGIGTYSISHISCINQSQRMPKPEGVIITAAAQSSGSDKNDENSNCSSYTGSGFSLWEESAVKKGKTGKENIAGNRHVTREGGMKMVGTPWMASIERPSQSSSAHNHPSTTISSLSSSRPSSASQKNPSFVDMLKSAKSSQEDEDDEEQEFVIKKEPSSQYKGVLSVKVDTAQHDQKPNTPRSKHSATEQRRRSKINDRFSTLRELIPHGDQKRDKASFLLEVIEYIQFLQEKVHKYEDSCRGWNNEPPTTISWNNNQRPTNGFTEQPHIQNRVSAPALANKGSVVINIPKKGQHLLDSDLTSHEQNGQHPRLTNRGSPFPSPLQPNIYSPGCGSTSVTAPHPLALASDAANTTSQLWQSRSCTTDCTTLGGDKLKDQELTIESGTVSISTIYSQGLLSTLTQALQSSGVDLSQANISVQIDLGKRANPSTHDSSTTILKKNEAPGVDVTLARSRLASTWDEKSDNPLKRFKTSRK
ncbi:hypothetical protein QVD17_02281 [Tagetes erecta]|uniref:BHLH domain-containing protein n=1 Tax=Tagetes erecta TaxID=13708 RepID=A0AAD8P909_TARER|nr:hypothetical protein QVD17_02281 [Tagetes erecta]